jgi:hypothetical protein
VAVAASGDGADFVNEEGGLFPCGEVAAPVAHRLALGPPRAPQPVTQISQRGAVHTDHEWLDLISHSRIIPGLTRLLKLT